MPVDFVGCGLRSDAYNLKGEIEVGVEIGIGIGIGIGIEIEIEIEIEQLSR